MDGLFGYTEEPTPAAATRGLTAGLTFDTRRSCISCGETRYRVKDFHKDNRKVRVVCSGCGSPGYWDSKYTIPGRCKINMREMKHFQNMELDDDVLNTVSGGSGSGNSSCYEPGDTIHFKVSCPACGRQCDDKFGFVATVQKRFQCDGERDMVQIQVDHCGGSVVQWIDHK